jgi:hypothetical protein
MTSQKISQLHSQLNFFQEPGYDGRKLVHEELTREQVLELMVAEEYQRMVSKNKLKSYGKFDLCLCIPTIISRRPSNLEDHSGDYIIDGQHKALKYISSDCDLGFPVEVLTHDPDATYKEVLVTEAKLFKSLNTQRSKLTTIDILRSDLVHGEDFAVHIECVMKSLNLECDRFGSIEDDATEIVAFGHFYNTVHQDYHYNTLGLEKIKSGYELWKKIYVTNKSNPADKVNGTAFRAICFLHKFSEELNNGRKDKFLNWCIDNLATNWNQNNLVKGRSSFDCARWILHEKIIARYNEQEKNNSGTGAQTIGPKTLVDAASKDKKFEHPDEDEWKNLLKGLKTR